MLQIGRAHDDDVVAVVVALVALVALVAVVGGGVVVVGCGAHSAPIVLGVLLLCCLGLVLLEDGFRAGWAYFGSVVRIRVACCSVLLGCLRLRP